MPHGVHAEGAGAWVGTRWEISTDKTLFLSAKGGDGGDGGQGEDGQDGGKGARGQDATKHRDATNGGPGQRGGEGGYGTDGADGGNGGTIFVRVNEQDANLLLALDWDISGGKGGDSGVHGNPGDGGEGGDGGVGCTCSRATIMHVVAGVIVLAVDITAKADTHGIRAPRATKAIKAHLDPDRIHIFAEVPEVFAALHTFTFQILMARKQLTGFEVVDENGDGINEPGEHILVRSIYVQNTGGMPTPTRSMIPVLIHGSMWLDPIPEPVYLPVGIQPGETVEVPGVLRAFIQQERAPRRMGVKFSATDEMKLIGVMPGIDRVLPDFCGSTTINISYPLELEAPRFLNSVERGSNVTFSWMLKNVSTKSYGIRGSLGRRAGTCLSENGGTRIFAFVDESGVGDARGLDLLDTLDPGTAVTIRQTFKVSDQAEPYSTGSMTLELVLSEPGNNEGRFSPLESAHSQMRSVMHYPLDMQISAKYTYNPAADYLLIVNADTKREVIHQICGLVADLGLQLDIWNMSVYGNFRDPNCTIPENADHVFYNYMGKSIIVLANPFEYFQRGTRTAFDLLDPQVVSYLATGGTQFLFPEAAASNPTWTNSVLFPTRPFDGTPDQRPGETTKKGMIAKVMGDIAPENMWIPCKGKLFKKPQSALNSDAKGVVQLLNKSLPMRRFAVSPSLEGSTKNVAGKIFIRHGLSLSTRIVTAFGRWTIEDSRPSGLGAYLLIAALPFKKRARLFWNYVGGTLVAEPEQQDVEKRPVVNVAGEIYKAICLSIMYELELEIAQFSASAPWPDVIATDDILKQLQKVDYLFSLVPNAPKIEGTSASDLDFLVETLGVLVAGVVPIGVTQWMGQKVIRLGNRRTHLRTQVLAKLETGLKAVFGDVESRKLMGRIMKECAATKKALKPAGGTILKVVLTKIASYSEEDFSTLPFYDSGLASAKSEVWAEGDVEGRINAHGQVMVRIADDERYSESMLRDMVDS
ncbi:unnamed protein product [Tuber aestivum]|uniref:DUF7932 domain-containing protein n=1 Tax=Tuber aestivum TaxID=59557 RepID=A0A292Q240_9PEZI|nr:unnamed protein product [Tuber aestivum]